MTTKEELQIDPETFYSVPRSQWGDGPWRDEPDRLEFKTKAGLQGLMVRNHQGSWCGYVAVPPTHPAHGMGRFDDLNVSCHGGLTYADECSPPICHVPEPGEPEHLWWFGFDCCHAMDLAPAMEAYAKRTMPHILKRFPHLTDSSHPYHPVYRDVNYVKNEVEDLAAQIAAIKPEDLKRP